MSGNQQSRGRGWLWYYSQDEERWNGGFDCRQDAIDEGMETYCGDPFLICRARHREIDFEISPCCIVDSLNDLNEEALDPDGDGLFFKLTRGQEAHLQRVVGEAIKNWAAYWGLSVESWGFAETTNQETIFATDAYDEHRRRHYHLRLAQMGFRAQFAWELNKLFELYPETKTIIGRRESFWDEEAK